MQHTPPRPSASRADADASDAPVAVVEPTLEGSAESSPSQEMGGAVSLAVSTVKVAAEKAIDSVRSSARNSRRSNRDRAGSDASWRPSEAARPSGTAEDAPNGSTTTVDLAAVSVAIDGLDRLPMPARRKGYGTVGMVLCSKFCIVQVVFNGISSVLMSLFLFWLLFVVLGGGGPYEWYHPNLTGVVVGSVLLVTPTCVAILAPAGLPEAVEKGWFYKVDPASVSPALMKWLPFLGADPKWRCGLRRHVVLGCVLAVVFIPFPILIARLAFGEMISTWGLIWYNIGFETVLSVPCTALGLLAFAMEPNFDRVKGLMSMHPSPIKRLGHRICGCLKLLC